MSYTLEQIIASLTTRETVDRWGIGTALHYVKSIGALLGGELNPAKAFSLADPSLWLKELEDAASRLTYCDALMADPEQITKSYHDGTGITPGAVAEFDCVVTSRRKDRDGDVLESAGMNVDKNAPLLWQHIQLQPIGKHLQVLSQGEDRIVSKLAIADTELGRDAAVLTKFGALRISQGFKPKKYEPLEVVKNAAGQDVVKGWHIKEAEIMEISLVSIPANTDAVVTAFSQGKLHAPLVKSWAKQYFDARPVQIPVNIELKINGQTLQMKDVQSDAVPPAASAQPPAEPPAESVEPEINKTVADDVAVPAPAAGALLTKMLWGAMDDELSGSFEWVQGKLEKTASNYLQLNGKTVADGGYVRLIATFADYAIVCFRPWDSKPSACYRLAWSLDASGVPAWTGDPIDVEITAEVREKFVEVPHRKDHPTIGELRKQLCREVAVLDSEEVIVELGPVVNLHDVYAGQLEAGRWGKFTSGLVAK